MNRPYRKWSMVLVMAGSVGFAGLVYAADSSDPSAFGRSGNQGEGFTKDQTIGGPGQPQSTSKQDAQITLGGARPTVTGEVLNISGDDYTIKDPAGGEVRLHVTKDTNMDCASAKGEGAAMATGRDNAQESKEIPPTAHMEKQASQDLKGEGQRDQHLGDQSGTQSRSTLGTESGGDVAKGSGFAIGPKSGCAFKVGDHVKAEVSDLGTVLFIKMISEEDAGSGSMGRGPQMLPQSR